MTIFIKGLLCTLGILGTGGVAVGGYFLKDYNVNNSATDSKSQNPEETGQSQNDGQDSQHLATPSQSQEGPTSTDRQTPSATK